MIIGNVNLQSLPTLILNEDVAVTADETIVELTGNLKSNTVTFITLQAVFESAGKVYIQNAAGRRHYLTNPDSDYPAKLQVLATYLIPQDDVVELKFSATTTMTNLIVTTGSGVY